jgi:hypothetical protein
MNTLPGVPDLKAYLKKVNWKLLIFLILLLNVKLVVKVAALVLIYILQPDFRFNFNIRQKRLPFFYITAIALSILNYFLFRNFSTPHYTITVLVGIGFWVACILVIHQLKLFAEKNSPQVIINTLVVFFVLNGVVSILQLLKIILETGALNPYLYQGSYQKYFISTGDYIKGISFDTCTTNAAVNAFGVLFFLHKKMMKLTLFCICVLLLTASNFVNILLAAILLILFIWKTNRAQKSVIVFSFFLIAIFMGKVTPQNSRYLTEVLDKAFHKQKPFVVHTEKILRDAPDSSLTTEELKKKTALLYLDSLSITLLKQTQPNLSKGQALAILVTTNNGKPVLPKDNIHTAPFQHKDDTTVLDKTLINFQTKELFATHKTDTSKVPRTPGKLLAMKQTVDFFRTHQQHLLTGAGMGNFSSKLAFRVSALRVAGGYPAKLAYINPWFLYNHLNLYLLFFSRQEKLHSIANSPNSVYDQVIGEYGIAGVLCFAFFYIGYYVKRLSKLSYGIPLLLLMMGLFIMDYWFEQLSIIFIFELLMFLDLKEKGIENAEN